MWSLVYLPITSTFFTALKASHTVTAFSNGCHQDLIYQEEESGMIPKEEIQPYFRINFLMKLKTIIIRHTEALSRPV